MTAGMRLALSLDGGDLVLGPGGIELDSGLTTAVLCSVLADARARPGDLPEERITGRRGWWPDTAGDRFGSRLWTLTRAKQTDEVLATAESFARESLEWLVRDGIAARVDVAAAWVARGYLRLTVTITRGASRRWSYLWATLASGTYSLEDVDLVIVAQS